MRLAGIDYSLTSPCMCLSEGPGFNNARFFYLTSVKKATGSFLNNRIIGVSHLAYTAEQERYDDIAEFFLQRIPINPVPKIFIEDYSFGSKWRVFNLAENCGLLKYKFWDVGYSFSTVPPTVIKKFATGKGNANKEQMYDAFVAETGVDLVKALFPDRQLGNPITDIVDSYYLSQYGYSLITVK